MIGPWRRLFILVRSILKKWDSNGVALIFFKTLSLPILNYIKIIRRARLRQIMRGYRKLKQENQLGCISLIKQSLTERPLNLTNKHFSAYLMGAGASSGEIIVRQYLLMRLGGINLNCALLLALGKEHGQVIYPLPKEWRDVLKQYGFKVANFRSSLLWHFYVFAALLYGVALIGKIVFAGIASVKNKDFKQKRYAYFADLGSGNLPQPINGGDSYDVVSWYLQWAGKAVDIEAIHHSVADASTMMVGDVSVVPQRRALLPLAGCKSIIKYAIWGVSASLVVLLDCLRGRWWHAFLLNQAGLAAQVRHLSADSLAREYLFHNSGWMYRPLWTYEAEQLGSKITFYFYSTNCEGYKKPDGYSPLYYGYKAMSWSHYLVWDEYQADFVKRAIGVNADINIVGSIWFQSSALQLPKITDLGVAVFDITPLRTSIYCDYCEDREILVPEVINPFLEHISCAILKINVLMLWKRKRYIGNRAHPLYRKLANRLAECNNIILIDPEISAIRIIESSVAVISMPFTSTAIIAKEMGKPSIYYDPSGLLQKDDRAAHGIAILSTRQDLETWLSHQVPSHLV
jgi:polysaccharide biosynthesis PFTS motif protein